MTKKIGDVSKWQGQIDFSRAKDELDLVIIRVQAGSTYEDPLHKIDEANCIHYGIPFGEYAYGKFISVPDAIQEAKDFVARADKDALFLVVDVEEQTCHNPADLVPATQAFIDYVKQATGKKVGLYTGHSFYGVHGMGAVKADFLWIPRYPTNDNGVNIIKPDMACDLHQFTQCGSVAGINGHVDLSIIANPDKPLSYYTGQESAPASQAQPAPQPVVKQAPAPTPTGKKIFLPASNETWTVYKMGYPASKSNPDNIAGQLAPKRFNGLTYDILGSTAPDVYIIKTDVYGLVQIYGAKDTGAVITNGSAPASAPAKPVVVPKSTTHKVASGDTLSEIALKNGTTVAKIKALNGLRSDLIRIGQVLKLR